MSDTDSKAADGTGLDVHGAEPITHRFTTTGRDGNPDVEFNIVMPLSPTRHAQLEQMLEEGYTVHDAYVLLAGGEILAHMDAIRQKKTDNE